MKNKKKNPVLRVILCILCVFLLANAVWFAWRAVSFGKYSDGMDTALNSSSLVPKYSFAGDDGYDYLLSYPDYLSLNGTLIVRRPDEDDGTLGGMLLIQKSMLGSSEYSVMLDDGTIYIDSEGHADDPADQEIAENNREIIDELLDRAEAQWGTVR